MRKLLFAAVLALGFCVLGPVSAHEPTAQPLAQPCLPLNEILSSAETVRAVKQYVVLDAWQTVGLVAWYNKIPPETSEKFNYAVLIFHVDGNVGMLLGNDGLVCKGGMVYPGEVQGMMNAISGDPA